ncbi:MAG: hypothetical protein ACI8PZ_004354 [Myxococcota bacterium]|jgi:hypothetical protein
MKVTLNKSQYRALNNLRALPADAHMLIMCSKLTPTGGVLDGSQDAFDELVGFISGEIADGMVSATAARALASLCVKIDPSCADWLGM